ncbi:maleate cis-trans isomerase family protein [Celeribacter indicus]|uniref:Arylmalonate decarboxylase n=1 Tax=Celeribacter indicus TaxID=1208324 RepID=A0A0B5DWE0_9RHOB|nr:aspartate/glutamate racemase family protein [Celeribacter indicus]AJE47688.1 arylmalonate decarboxylase [Celeribacter indicus]SDW14318.1 maleate isomerase [Celeribacter indicus]
MARPTPQQTTTDSAPAGRAGTIRFGTRARFGILMPSGNSVAEGELAAMVPADISLHVTRLRLTGSSPEELAAMTQDIEGAASLVADVRPDLIGFHCTAVSMADADAEADILARARQASGREVVATSEAAVAALAALGARRIVLVTPYLDHIVASEVAFLNRHGIAVTDAFGAGLNTTDEMARVDPERWHDMTRAHRSTEADAYFISCTAIRSLPVVERLEAVLGKPVITSNQVMAWHMLRKAGIPDRPQGFGRLLGAH